MKEHPAHVVRVVASLAFLALLFETTAFKGNQAHAHEQHAFGAIYPQVSRSGKQIVFAYQGAIWRLDRQQGLMKRLTSKAGYDCWPAWSPDAKTVVYINGRGSHIGPIAFANASDGKPVSFRSGQNPIAKHKLSYSPDGKRILGLFHKDGRYGIRWLDLQTKQLGNSLYPDNRGLRYALSMDGKTIALVTTLDVDGEQGGNNGPQCTLWTLSASGGDPTKLVEFPGRVYDVTWSGDGKSLIVVSNVGGAHNDLWQVPLIDPLRNMKKLTLGQADEDVPSTDATGNWLIYTDNRKGPTMLMARNLKSDRTLEIPVLKRDYNAPTGRLALTVEDADGNKSVTARVSIQDENSKYHAPPNALYRMMRRDIHFYCEGKTELQLPAGKYTIKVARGPEYRVTQMTTVVQEEQLTTAEVQLQRWTHQRARSWYSGESHIHANYGYGEWYNSPRTMLAQSAGEDLIVNNFMVANSEADGVFDRQYFRGAPDPLSTPETILYWNQEFRSTIWGHLTLLDLKQLVEPIFTGFARTTNPHDHPTNADIADHVHDQDAHVNYTHPAQNVKDPYLSAYSAKALPLDVALGKVDSMDIMGSNQNANMALWYKLLNCGFQVPASAGTDCFLNRIRSRLPGQVRVYVHVKEPFTYRRWVAGLRAGKTFVTDGPMLEFSVNGKAAGDKLELTQPDEITVEAKATAQYPLDRAEVIVNGEVVHTVKAQGDRRSVIIKQPIKISSSGWIAVRAIGPPHPEQPTNGLFAHTSPVYLQLKDRPLNTSDSARYFVTWVDRLRTEIRRRNRVPSRHRLQVEQQMAAAREKFIKLIQQ